MRLIAMHLCILYAGSAVAQEAKLAVLPTQVEKSAKGKVPELFDDYLLTAIQEIGKGAVIGQEDIDAMLGFERTKELMGCDDVSCMADIGGALGVDELVHVKIAKLDGDAGDWVVTTKLIDSSGPTVKARTSDFVTGDTKALLQAVPNIVRKLFAGGGMATTTPKVTPPPADASMVHGVEQAFTSPTYDDNYGGGARTGGVILTVIGVAAGIAGAAVAVTGVAGVDQDVVDECGDTDDCYDSYRGDYLAATGLGIGVAGAGMALFGVGQSVFLNGKARAYAGNDSVKGYHSKTWLGWFLAGVAIVGPLLDAAVDLEPLGNITGIGGLLGSMGVFAYTMMSSSGYYRTEHGTRIPMAQMMLLRDRSNQTVPAFGLAFKL